jgi:hypothetical protein
LLIHKASQSNLKKLPGEQKGGGDMKHRRMVYLFSGIAVTYGLILVGSVQAMNINNLTVVAANEVQPAKQTPSAKDMPMGQSAKGQPSLLPENAGVVNEKNIYGIEGGYFHPYITAEEQWTDNLYNIKNDKTHSYITTFSPGVWFSLPRKKEIPITITPHNSSPGGLQQQLKNEEGTDRYVAYALGGLNFKYYSANSKLNTVDGDLEGFFRYNMRGGLSLQALDRFTRGVDNFDIGSFPGDQFRQGKYKSNIVMATADYRMTEKLRAKLDYSNFNLKYDENFDAFKERTDNALDLYGYYVYSEKTSFFLEDKYIDVGYSSATENNNKQNFIFGGIDWKSTEKTSFLAKVGWQKRNFNNNGTGINRRNDYSGLALDLQTVYKYSEKTKLTWDLYRTNEETDSTEASGKTVLGTTFQYKQKVTDKIRANLGITYENANYNQLISQKRDDKTFVVRPSIQYLFKEWLMGELSYSFQKRNSSDNIFNYQSNTIYADLNFAL